MAGINETIMQCDWNSFDLLPNTKAFLKRVYASGLAKYERRLASLGFSGGERALDAGCGLGQWSVVLSQMCGDVCGIDVSEERVSACNAIMDALKICNTQFVTGPLEQLPYPDAHFDRVICYSVLYLTDYEKSIKEFARVTRTGGLVYISTNGIGRYIYDVIKRPNPAPDFDPRIYGLKTILNTFSGKRSGLSPQNGGVAMNPARTSKILLNSGFEILEIGAEGTLREGKESFVSARHYGFTGAFDILARKKGP